MLPKRCLPVKVYNDFKILGCEIDPKFLCAVVVRAYNGTHCREARRLARAVTGGILNFGIYRVLRLFV